MIWVAKAGYAARGLVYLLIAYFASLAALGQGRVRDAQQALAGLADVPHGRLLLWALILGLLLFAGWRIVQGVLDADHHGHRLKGCTVRLALLISAALYGSLALGAIKLAIGSPERAQSAVQWTARALAQPWGRALVAVGALILAGIGLAHFVKAARRGFLRYLSEAARQAWIIRISQIGLVSRGLVFLLFATFTTRAAWRSDPEATKDLTSLLQWLQSLPHPAAWIGMAAAGLAAFGLYSLLQARYRTAAPARSAQPQTRAVTAA
jgi:hypothetical protein